MKIEGGNISTAVEVSYVTLSMSYTVTSPLLAPAPSIINGTVSVSFITEISASPDNKADNDFLKTLAVVGISISIIVFVPWAIGAVFDAALAEQIAWLLSLGANLSS